MVMNSHRKVFSSSTLCWGTRQHFFLCSPGTWDGFISSSLFILSVQIFGETALCEGWEEMGSLLWNCKYLIIPGICLLTWVFNWPMNIKAHFGQLSSEWKVHLDISWPGSHFAKVFGFGVFLSFLQTQSGFQNLKKKKLSRTFSWFLCEHA